VIASEAALGLVFSCISVTEAISNTTIKTLGFWVPGLICVSSVLLSEKQTLLSYCIYWTRIL